ncbi:MAG: acyltransferase [Eubacterium sp.]|nr:acyltransferase [Eubacterium sp.]
MENKRYNGLDGVRALAAIGVAVMHVMYNGGYKISGFIAEKLIGNMGDFVFLFMIVSAFSLCCGYYDKIINKKISPTEFYAKRFKRILPFFALVCIMDFALSPDAKSAMELFAELTLCFGLLPNPQMSVIGVGWFIGLIFVFYIAFPFFCSLIANKRRAWSAFAVSIALNLMCEYYFFSADRVVNFDYRSNIIYAAPYFFIGGLIYLYRDSISKMLVKLKYPVLLLCFGSAALVIAFGRSIWTILPTFALLTVYAMRENSPLLENKAAAFLSSISMEIYLCHMMFFRLIEKLKLSHLFENDILSYIFTAAVTLAAAIVFSFAVKKIFSIVESKALCRKNLTERSS